MGPVIIGGGDVISPCIGSVVMGIPLPDEQQVPPPDEQEVPPQHLLPPLPKPRRLKKPWRCCSHPHGQQQLLPVLLQPERRARDAETRTRIVSL
jgi:hypothetical protein